MEDRLFKAISLGNTLEVKQILRQNPNIDVNRRNRKGRTPLHEACLLGPPSIVSLLLARPDINVNIPMTNGESPFWVTCMFGRTESARLLLRDSRIKTLNSSDSQGYTALKWASFGGHIGVVESWIASGKEIDLGTPGDFKTDAIGEAKRKGHVSLAILLENFRETPEDSRHEVRARTGWYVAPAAEVFALMVFTSDGLLGLRQRHLNSAVSKFFSIASQLPMELQMVLCYRLVGSRKCNIPVKDCEVAFKKLAKKLIR